MQVFLVSYVSLVIPYVTKKGKSAEIKKKDICLKYEINKDNLKRVI